MPSSTKNPWCSTHSLTQNLKITQNFQNTSRCRKVGFGIWLKHPRKIRKLTRLSFRSVMFAVEYFALGWIFKKVPPTPFCTHPAPKSCTRVSPFPVHPDFAYYLDILYSIRTFSKISGNSSANNELVAKTFRIRKNFPVSIADALTGFF